MTEWHGYEQHPDAHPGRPWWRQDPSGFWDLYIGDERTGARSDTADPKRLAAFDAAHPLPSPPPRCGQVWVWVHGWPMPKVVIDEEPPHHFARWDGLAGSQHIWPPPGAVLVAGPGSPWAPMGEPPE